METISAETAAQALGVQIVDLPALGLAVTDGQVDRKRFFEVRAHTTWDEGMRAGLRHDPK